MSTWSIRFTCIVCSRTTSKKYTAAIDRLPTVCSDCEAKRDKVANGRTKH